MEIVCHSWLCRRSGLVRNSFESWWFLLRNSISRWSKQHPVIVARGARELVSPRLRTAACWWEMLLPPPPPRWIDEWCCNLNAMQLAWWFRSDGYVLMMKWKYEECCNEKLLAEFVIIPNRTTGNMRLSSFSIQAFLVPSLIAGILARRKPQNHNSLRNAH